MTDKLTIHDYDVTLTGGLQLSVTVDLTKGDKVTLGDGVLYFYLSAKPDRHNPKVVLAEEEIIVPLQNALAIKHTTKLVDPPNDDTLTIWRDTIAAVAGMPTPTTTFT